MTRATRQSGAFLTRGASGGLVRGCRGCKFPLNAQLQCERCGPRVVGSGASLGGGLVAAAAPAVLAPERRIWQVAANAPVGRANAYSAAWDAIVARLQRSAEMYRELSLLVIPVGSTDLTFGEPGPWHIEAFATQGEQVRAYSDQAVLLEQPHHAVYVTSIFDVESAGGPSLSKAIRAAEVQSSRLTDSLNELRQDSAREILRALSARYDGAGTAQAGATTRT